MCVSVYACAHSGTTAHVGISLYGRESRSGHRHLDSRGAFARNSLDIFHVATDTNLGNIWQVRIWHDNKGEFACVWGCVCVCVRAWSRCVSGSLLVLLMWGCSCRFVPGVAAAVRPRQGPADRKQLLLPGGGVAVGRQRQDRGPGGVEGGGHRWERGGIFLRYFCYVGVSQLVGGSFKAHGFVVWFLRFFL